MKRVITVMLILFILFDFLHCNIVFGADTKAPDLANIVNDTITVTTHKSTNGDDISDETEEKNISEKKGSVGETVVLGIVSLVIIVIPYTLQTLLTLTILPDNFTKAQIFTIEDLLLDRFDLFNVNFLNISNTAGFGTLNQVPSSTNSIIKQNVANWFYAIRTFSIVASLGVLIVIGILMAISTIASEKARYKNMLIHWLASFAILMLLPYIMSIAFSVCDVTVGLIRNVTENFITIKVNNSAIEQTKGLNFEKTLIYGKMNEDGTGFDGMQHKIYNLWLHT